MIALPVTLAVLRKPIDRMLLPLLPMRRKIPRLFLVAAGLAAPYAVAFLLYRGGPIVTGLAGIFTKLGPLAAIGNAINTFSFSLTQYNYMRLTVILGPLVAYLITRTPQEASRAGAGGGHAAAVTATLLAVVRVLWNLFLTFAPLLLASVCFADECQGRPAHPRLGADYCGHGSQRHFGPD